MVASRPYGAGKRRSWGRLLAQLLCLLFAAIGTIPLSLGLLVRTRVVRDWAARETSALLVRDLGVKARYELQIRPWPLSLGLEHLVVDATDGGSPFLEVEQVLIRPRTFALLAGSLDVGDVAIVGPRARIVVRDGELANLAVKPLRKDGDTQGESTTLAKFGSVAITDASIDASIDGMSLRAREVDLDVSSVNDAVELSVRAGPSTLTRTHAMPGRADEEDAVDEDVLCELDGRLRLEPDKVIVKRLHASGSADFDPDPGTTPGCSLGAGDWRRFAVDLNAAHVQLHEGTPESAGGHIRARVPVPLVHRFVDASHATGSVTIDVDAAFDRTTTLPRVTGRLWADSPGIETKIFGQHLEAGIFVADDVVKVHDIDVDWADGKVIIDEVAVEPLAKDVPLTATGIFIKNLQFASLLRDLGAHPASHVTWLLRDGRVPEFKGTLNPLSLDGPMRVETQGFEVFDRPARDPGRVRMLGLREATLEGRFQVHPTAVVLSNFTIETPGSRVRTTVSLGYAVILDFDLKKGSVIDLSELSPLAILPAAGRVTLEATGHGRFNHPKIVGDASIEGFSLGGLELGEVERAHIAFEPIVAQITDVWLRHGKSRMLAPRMRLDFESGPNVILDADLDTTAAPHLSVADFLSTFQLDKDPRWDGLEGIAKGHARVHYVNGGREDRCDGGLLEVDADMNASDVLLFGERYDDGHADLSFRWDDQRAGAAGMEMDLHSATLRKDAGTVVASGTVRHGGLLRMSTIGSGIPIARVDMFAGLGAPFDGTISFVGDFGGSFGAVEANVSVDASRVRIGPASLPPSHLVVTMEPAASTEPPPMEKTRCGNAVAATFNRAEFNADASGGVFRARGSVFGGQIVLDDVTVTEQRRKIMAGSVRAANLDLGVLANLVPGIAFTAKPPSGRLRGKLDMVRFPLGFPAEAELLATIDELGLERDGQKLSVRGPEAPLLIRADELMMSPLAVLVESRSGLGLRLSASGAIHHVTTAPDFDLGLHVAPMEIAVRPTDVPSISRAGGTLEGDVRISGSASSARYVGALHLTNGELALKDGPFPLSNLSVDVEFKDDEIRLKRAVGTAGGGSVLADGRAEVHGLAIGAVTGNLVARSVKLPLAEGVDAIANADLSVSYRPDRIEDGERALPEVEGNVSLLSFDYTRPIGMNLELGQLAAKQRTSVETFDPDQETLRFRVAVDSPRPLRIANNLVDMQLEVGDSGLVLSGTNQRFGAIGLLRILPDSKLKLRTVEFDIREGLVRFDDLARISPKVDVRAQTEFRRAAEQSAASDTSSSSASSGSGSGSGAAAAGSRTAGQWRITMNAHGEPDKLKVELISDPPLGQEDIVLLLTMGMTRAEIDRGLASSLGQTVGLEALSQLTGADKAVKTVVPIIDEFRFGTGYSSRTGRTEPTVTLGKRIGDGVRANVTSGLTENREVRSSLEWRLNRRVSVQGSYDNVNDVSSSVLGNVGADLRFRLEFE